jgi:hypothetical protein
MEALEGQVNEDVAEAVESQEMIMMRRIGQRKGPGEEVLYSVENLEPPSARLASGTT